MRSVAALAALLFALAPLSAEARYRRSRPTFPRHCSGCSTKVKGHYRTSSTGKTYYVKSHTRTY